MSTGTGKGTKAAACPVCGKPAVPATRPFCSRRCADVDLARWLRGDYRLPGRDGEAALTGQEDQEP